MIQKFLWSFFIGRRLAALEQLVRLQMEQAGRFQKKLNVFAAQLEEFTKAINLHNADDAHFQAQVNQRLAQLQAKIDPTADAEVNQAFLNLKAAINAQPVLVLSEIDPTLPTNTEPTPPAETETEQPVTGSNE